MAEEVIRGKNSGKKNATTDSEQAKKEAKARWTKKLKSGYVESIEQARAGEVDTETIKGGVAPMLARTWSSHKDKVRYPCFVQPKLDGHRAIAVVKDGKATLWTRTRKPITSMRHLEPELVALGEGAYDGELYNEYMSFEELTGLIRTPRPSKDAERVDYHIYDLAHASEPYSIRHDVLKSRFRRVLERQGASVQFVRTYLASDEQDMFRWHQAFTEDGHEGLMIRSYDGLYKHGRSYDLLKVKEFDSSEFLVVGVKEGKGKLAGHAVFTCIPALSPASFKDPGATFDVKMAGPQDDLKKYWTYPSLAIGRKLEVKFQGTTERGVPGFPVGLRFRDDV